MAGSEFDLAGMLDKFGWELGCAPKIEGEDISSMFSGRNIEIDASNLIVDVMA